MFEQINEKIEVVAKFSEKVIPVKFFWQGREIVVSKVNLAYSQMFGRTKLYYFAVSDSANYYKLQFNTENLAWTLLESYAD